MIKQGVCVLVLGFDEDNIIKVLVCERKDGNGFCLPGGKIDPEERADQAATRELFEETGIWIPSSDLRHLYSGVDIEGWVTTCFYLPGKIETKDFFLSPGSGEPECHWGAWNELFGPPFGDYNRKVFEVANL